MRRCAACTLSNFIAKAGALYHAASQLHAVMSETPAEWRGVLPADAVSLHDVGDVLEARQDLAQLRNILDLDDQAQFRQATIDVHLDIRDVDAFGVQQIGDIAHQALSIIGADADRNRECAYLCAPIHAHQALPVLAAAAEGCSGSPAGGWWRRGRA